MGGASAMEDSIALANAIHEVTKRHPDGKPSNKEVTTALQQFQDERLPRLKKIHDESAFVTRLQSFDTWFLYLLMRWILPLIGLAPIVHNVSKLGSQGPRLKYVEVNEKQGTIPWSNPQPKASMKTAAG
jgi:2-polyprenyl-6-methoxyphenol hydroxylase-like FAD-dependent oxidoreductase